MGVGIYLHEIRSGKDNVKGYLRDNPEVASAIEAAIRKASAEALATAPAPRNAPVMAGDDEFGGEAFLED